MVTVHLVFGHLELYLLLVDALQLSGALKALPSTSEAFAQHVGDQGAGREDDWRVQPEEQA